LVHPQGFEGFSEVGDEGIGGLRLNHHVINVSVNILPYLVLKATLDGSLISSTRILVPEGRGHIAIGAKRSDE
jgi:hypothetical protein